MTVMQKSAALGLEASFIVLTMSHTSASPVSAFERPPAVERQPAIEPDPELRDPDFCLMDGCTDDDIVICPAERRITKKVDDHECPRREATIQLLDEERRGPKVHGGGRGSRLP